MSIACPCVTYVKQHTFPANMHVYQFDFKRYKSEVKKKVIIPKTKIESNVPVYNHIYTMIHVHLERINYKLIVND